MAGFFGDQLKAALKRAQRAGARELALGEKTDHLAILQRADDDADGFQRLLAADVHGGEDAGKGADRAVGGKGLIHHETHRPRAGGGEEERIREGDVIGQQKHAALRRDALRMHRADSIDGADQCSADHPDEVRRQHADDQHRGHQTGRGNKNHLHPETVGSRHPKRLGEDTECDDEHHGENAGQAVLKVHRGLQLTAFGRRIMILHPGVERCQKHRRGIRQHAEDC